MRTARGSVLGLGPSSGTLSDFYLGIPSIFWIEYSIPAMKWMDVCGVGPTKQHSELHLWGVLLHRRHLYKKIISETSEGWKINLREWTLGAK